MITLEGIEKKKLKKMTTKQSEHQPLKKTATNDVVASWVLLPAYIVRLFDSHFSLIYLSGLKYILARQIVHFSR